MRTTTLPICLLALALPTMGAAQAATERAAAPQSGPLQTIDARTTGFQKLDGYVPLYWDQRTGSLWMEIDRLDTEMLYSTGLTAGLSSSNIGLDRGQSGQGRVVKFQRIASRVLMVQPNYSVSTNSANPDERGVVRPAFARACRW